MKSRNLGSHTPAAYEAVSSTVVDPAAVRQRVLRLAWPVIGQNLLETMLGIIDTLLVAGLGAAAIAGVGTALQIMFFILAALAALAVGSSVLVAQAVGASGTGRASQLARQSLLWSIMLSVPLALGGLLLTGPIIWLLLETVGGGLVSVWGAFLLVAPLIAVLHWRRFRHTVMAGEIS